MSLATATILIADDDLANRALLRATLERAGYAVVEACDGEGALSAIRQSKPDLALLDVNMPAPNGMEVTAALRRDAATALMPIILVTALAATEDKIRGLDAGATDFVTKPFQPAELLARVRSNLRFLTAMSRLEAVQDVLVSLANAVEAKDPSTEHHCARLAQAAISVARAMELPDEQVEAVGYGAVLHDVGKIGIAESILRKKGSLTEQEWEEMRRHSMIGALIVEPLRIGSLVAPIIRHHHERWDGGGYPDGIRGSAIPIGARIVAVADSFDAMTHDRPYRPAMSAEHAVAELGRESGRQFDGDVVHLFLTGYLVGATAPTDTLAAITHGLYESADGG